MAGKTEFRVGLFVIVAIVIGGGLVFMIGNQSNLFSSKTRYRAVFDSVSGLRPGSPVRIAGVPVGTVDGVELGEDGKIHVELTIVDSATNLLRVGTLQPDGSHLHGSIASIGSKGLLGDKLVDITVGTEGVPIQPGGTVQTASEEDLMVTAGNILDEVRGAIVDERFLQDVSETTHNVAAIAKMAAEGDGTFRRVMTDPELARSLDQTLANVRTATDELAKTSRSLRAITDEVRSGDGTAHALIYGDDGARLARNLADASGEITQLLRDVRTGDGTLHDVIYEDEANQLVENLTATSADLRSIVGDIRAGRGTIGGLLVDPSVYEDVKRLVGDLERNDILRALVRYSIRRDESAGRVDVTAAPQSTPAASAPP